MQELVGVPTDCVIIEGVMIKNRPSTYVVVLAMVVCSWFANRVHCMKVIVRLAGSCRRMGGVDGQLEQWVTVQNTICGSRRSCSPDDGHNGPRNILR